MLACSQVSLPKREARTAAEQLLRFQLALDVPGVHRKRIVRDERIRTLMIRAMIFVGALALIVGCVWLVRWLSKG